jgi:hypothetical protein
MFWKYIKNTQIVVLGTKIEPIFYSVSVLISNCKWGLYNGVMTVKYDM